MSDRYRRVYDHDWHHPEFRRLDDGARVVRLYLSAGPQTTSCGCFRLSTALAVEDLGGSAEDFERRLAAVCEAFCWEWDGVARVIWLTDWFQNNPPANPNVVASWVKLLRNVPDCDVRTHAIASVGQSLKELPASFRAAWKDLPKSFREAPALASSLGNPVGKPQAETHQGSGSRDQRSEEQGAGARSRESAGASRRPPKNGKAETLPDAARQTLRLTDPNAPIDHLFEVLVSQCELRYLRDYTKADAIDALNAAISERRQSFN
jgi:hypothetical protein